MQFSLPQKIKFALFDRKGKKAAKRIQVLCETTMDLYKSGPGHDKGMFFVMSTMGLSHAVAVLRARFGDDESLRMLRAQSYAIDGDDVDKIIATLDGVKEGNAEREAIVINLTFLRSAFNGQ
ncbi:MAG: hypothetical protein VX730_08000 [Pseudomonadota bacterium]|nr:hypothetical protein [Pseudomonadota bacterium]